MDENKKIPKNIYEKDYSKKISLEDEEEEEISETDENSFDRFQYLQVIKISVFGVVLMVFCIIGMVNFLRPTISKTEKRELAKFPEITLEGVWDGSYFKGIDIWYSDTYPLREVMIVASQKFQNLYGIRSEQIVSTGRKNLEKNETVASAAPKKSEEKKKSVPVEENLPDGTVKVIGEMRGDIYITNNCGYELYDFVEEPNLGFVKAMNDIYSRFDGVAEVYVMMVPTSAGVMLDKTVWQDMGVGDQADAIKFDYERLNPKIHTVNTIDILRKHNAEYIYFHTDHHWTALGAYYAYVAFCQEKGITPHDIKNYEKVEFPGFLGSFYDAGNRSPELAVNPDTVIAYYPKGTRKMMFTMRGSNEFNEGDIISDATYYDSNSKYIAFVNGDLPFSYAHNENIHDGSAVVVIKDSLGNAFVPWLVDHYEYTYWIDARYTNATLSQMVLDYHVQDIIYEVGIYGASNPYMYNRYDLIGR